MTDPNILNRIVAAADLSPDDRVLEVGPGVGNLTHHLADAAATVVAVEIDARMIPVLAQELGERSNVRVVQGDILTFDPAALMDEQPYKVVANLPYAITSAFLRHVLEARIPPQTIVVTIQREVAERIVARDGRMSLLAVSVQFYGRPRVLFRLKPGAFYPPPAVESAVLRIDRAEQPTVAVDDAGGFFRVVRAGFSQPRKQLQNSLAAGLALPKETVAEALHRAGIDARRRAETLSLEEWERVAQVLA